MTFGFWSSSTRVFAGKGIGLLPVLARPNQRCVQAIAMQPPVNPARLASNPLVGLSSVWVKEGCPIEGVLAQACAGTSYGWSRRRPGPSLRRLSSLAAPQEGPIPASA